MLSWIKTIVLITLVRLTLPVHDARMRKTYR